jgi:hypothetical protein
MTDTDQEIEAFLKETFERNFELLKLESGHTLNADIKEVAWMQVLFYWRKLKDIANRVTDTEVRLNLPGQVTPQGKKFGIEGVVDIVREDEKTVMYDIKTHEADQVRENIGDYENQLNIYAHIWKNLRGQPLDATTIIATAYPDALKEALADGDPGRVEYEYQKWDPLVEIKFDPDHVDEVINHFGSVVDCIENGEFHPASLDRLSTRSSGENEHFASHICRYCDARFSCESYRKYAFGGHGRAELAIRQYLDDYGTEVDQQDWLSASLETGLSADLLD